MASRNIAVDRLPEAGSSLEVVLLEDARFGAGSDRGPRRPHRHDYHELVWTPGGSGQHLIDGEVSLVEPNTITLIGRGQVHVLERASGLHGALVWFGEELLHGDPATGANPAWLVGSAAVRAPIAEGGRFAWFANRGIGRPVAESLEATIQWFRLWLDEIATAGRPVVLIGFSGGAAAAGGLLLADSQRSSGVAILSGTLPFEAGLDTGSGALAGTPVFVAQGDADTVIALGLQQRTWAYLHGDSGALITGHRDGGGHGLTLPAGDALRAWLAQRIA